ncbi:inositol monophosphatase [Oricola sp.]|uniref:inositol monophosphatase family protein n=1 Tax=Oricola sp. TaxID=1979950 RepID=UPI0025E68382|nr:inositol monophosphatase [Oricola sp.]MCI5076924.1 inositol monophosphatase [Oricola sp.]
MNPSDTSNTCGARFAVAEHLIRDAGRMALDYFDRYQTLAIEEKSSGQDIVSVADKAVETYLSEQIRRRFPDDAIVGEEHGGIAGASGFQWIIDPIDGTGCFLHGLRSWSVVIAILDHGTPVAGLILEPCANRLYSAERGSGAFCDDAPIRVDSMTPFDAGLFAVGASLPEQSAHIGSIIAGILANGGSYMRNGSAALSLAHVAAGHYLGFYEPVLNAWDCVAGLLIVSEAGGEADDFLAGGDITAKRPCFAASPRVAPEFRAIIGT